MKYVIHVGRSKELALAELFALLGSEAIRKVDNSFVLVETDRFLDQSFIDTLGGSIAIYKLFSTLRGEIDKNDLVETIVDDLRTRESKINISFEYRKFGFKDNKQILKDVKKNLKKLEISCRFIEKASTASFLGSGFLNDKVAAYKIFDIGEVAYFGKMVALQNINSYSLRDYEKPYRDAKLGMHPPKLSQIMLNLAGEYKKVYDPFCGTGTVLLEAALQFKSVQGSDIMPENVFGSIKNLDWIAENYKINGLVYDVFQGDARKLSRDNFKDVDIVVTEGYLGEPKRGIQVESKLLRESRELEKLYYDFLRKSASVLDRPVAFVLNFPVLVAGRKRVFFKNLVEKLKPLGYSVSVLLPEREDLGLTETRSLVYERSGQKVLREVVRLDYIPG